MNTRKHLNILDTLTTVLLAFSLVGAIVCFFAMIADEGSTPILVCAILSLSLYFSKVFLNVIIDFYDTIITKNKTLNTPNIDFINSQEQ